MSRDAAVTFDWADATYTFRLGIAQLRELQEKCDAGPQWIEERILLNLHGGLRIDDLIQTIRLGLIGGGMEPVDALKLVRRYVEERPYEESKLPAVVILQAARVGAPDEQLGKSQAAKETASHLSPEAKSDLPPSTESAL